MRKLDLTNPHQKRGQQNLKEVMADLKFIRKARGLTQAQLADITGLSISIISKYERGLFPTRVVWLAAYCDFLGLELSIELAPLDK